MKIIALLLLALFAITTTSVRAAKDPACESPIMISGEDAKNCEAFNEVWAYKAEANECVNFIHGGCGANLNEFTTLEECEQKCKT